MTGRKDASRPIPSVVGVYQRHGAAWAASRGTALVEAGWLDRFGALVPAGGAVLDIGCGTGVPLARDLLRRGYAVTGLDATPTMLALFRRNLPGVEVLAIDMRTLALGRRFAGLLGWDSFFHLSPEDQRRMFPRFQAHAAPGAALMFTSGDVEGEAIGDLDGEPLYHGSLSEDEYAALLSTHGFDVIAHTIRDPACGYRTVWLARRRAPGESRS